MLVSLNQIAQSEERYLALQETSEVREISKESKEAVFKTLPDGVTKGPILGSDVNLEKRKEMLETIGQEPVDFAFERAIGKNDSVYSNFIELIEDAKRKVGRIVVKRGSKNIGFATGFMVSEKLLLTNWHVFKTKEEIIDSEVQFFYELDTRGNPSSPISFKLDADLFFHSNQELDYCFVGVSSADITGQISIRDIGYIFLDPALGKLGNEGQEALNIIHHPDGDYKQLSIRENRFKRITPISIWYETDTAQGSSGSPVFNDQWQVVALHHMGIGKKNAAGDYIDKEGNIIPKVNNKIDVSKIVWEANEGIRISVILKDINKLFPSDAIVQGLKEPPAQAVPKQKSIIQIPKEQQHNTEINHSQNNSSMDTQNTPNSVSISFPASLVEKNGIVNISINQGQASTQLISPAVKQLSADELFTEEIKKLEGATDFSLCKGYQASFLGTKFNIPMPELEKPLKKFASKLDGSDSIILKYFHYSVIVHSIRKMPIISAINVDGDMSKRLDKTERKDVWLRDTRMGFEKQLDDDFYKGSGFDRGHMSRREDANWGEDAIEAKRNADLTCMYVNACPQVPKINQSSRKGLWGILEKVILEEGAEGEKKKTAKITVFNGPIFQKDDPVFRGVQVPMDFFKIVLWLTDKGALKATAFKLSQVELVDDIDFEQLDLDQNTQFKEFQCSIKWLQKVTQIDFSPIAKFDTFDGKKLDDGVEMLTDADLIAHLKKNNK